MPAIILPDRWRRQPTRIAGIDSGSQLASGITAAFTQAGTGTLYDYVNRVFPSADTSTHRVFAPSTVGRDYSGTANTQFANAPGYMFAGPFTLFALLDVDALSGYSHIAACQANPARGWEIRLGNGTTESNILIHRANTIGAYRQQHTGANRIAAGSKGVAVAVVFADELVESVPTVFVRGGGNSYFYGAASTLATGTATGTAEESAAALWIGRRIDGSTQLDGGVQALYLYRRAVSENELIALSENPWKVFKKSARILYFPSAGGGGATILPSGLATDESFGSHTLTAGAVTIEITGKSTDESFGSHTLSSFASILPNGKDTDEGFGSAVLTTGAVTILVDGKITDESFGSATLSRDGGIDVTGLGTDEAFGSLSLIAGAVTITVTGLATSEAFGQPSLAAGIIVTGLDTSEAFGNPTLTMSLQQIYPDGLGTQQAFGLVVITGGTQVSTISTFSAVTLVSVSLDAIELESVTLH